MESRTDKRSVAHSNQRLKLRLIGCYERLIQFLRESVFTYGTKRSSEKWLFAHSYKLDSGCYGKHENIVTDEAHYVY